MIDLKALLVFFTIQETINALNPWHHLLSALVYLQPLSPQLGTVVSHPKFQSDVSFHGRPWAQTSGVGGRLATFQTGCDLLWPSAPLLIAVPLHPLSLGLEILLWPVPLPGTPWPTGGCSQLGHREGDVVLFTTSANPTCACVSEKGLVSTTGSCLMMDHTHPMPKEIAAAAAKSLQSCPTLCNPTDSSPPGSSVPGILQARTLEWVAISFSKSTLL